MTHETIYLIESRPARGGRWVTRDGFFASYSEALRMVELTGLAARRVYRIVPFIRAAAE